MNESQNSSAVNRAKPYQMVLFPLNNGATNVYYVLVLSYIATFGSKVLALSMIFASVMVTGMRLFDAVTDPIIGALMDRTNGKFGKFRPFMVIGNLIMAVSILVLYCLTPLIPDTMMWARYAVFVALYAVWVIGYTFQTSCTRSGQTVLTNDPKQRPLFTIFNTVGSLLGMGAMQFFAPILAKNYEGGYGSAGHGRVFGVHAVGLQAGGGALAPAGLHAALGVAVHVEPVALLLRVGEHLLPVQVDDFVAAANIVVHMAVDGLVVIHAAGDEHLGLVFAEQPQMLGVQQLADLRRVAAPLELELQQKVALILADGVLIQNQKV